MNQRVAQRADYTFKYNQKLGRHGWLRLTPAYSVKLVKHMIAFLPTNSLILDPFSGTATTGLVAAEHGLTADCFDINPFLVWFGKAKCAAYTHDNLQQLKYKVQQSLERYTATQHQTLWVPAIHNIHRWWSKPTLQALAMLRQALVEEWGEPQQNVPLAALAWIAFCRLVIETSSAAFNHISMSFHDQVLTYTTQQIKSLYAEIIECMLQSILDPIPGTVEIFNIDSSSLEQHSDTLYSQVITSPPYPNRISYIRELRPYMYWTKFLDTGRDAGELDWQTIGGTWGIATSRLTDWHPSDVELPGALHETVTAIQSSTQKHAQLMATYVWKYFHDMHQHFAQLRTRLQSGAVLAYIVGNSSFYDVPVATERLFAQSLTQLGYTHIGWDVVRKRNSKKDLYEYCVYATWDSPTSYHPLFNQPSAAQQLSLFPDTQ